MLIVKGGRASTDLGGDKNEGLFPIRPRSHFGACSRRDGTQKPSNPQIWGFKRQAAAVSPATTSSRNVQVEPGVRKGSSLLRETGVRMHLPPPSCLTNEIASLLGSRCCPRSESHARYLSFGGLAIDWLDTIRYGAIDDWGAARRRLRGNRSGGTNGPDPDYYNTGPTLRGRFRLSPVGIRRRHRYRRYSADRTHRLYC